MLMTEGELTSADQRVDIPFSPYGPLRKKWRYYLLTEIKAGLPRTKENAKLIDYLFKSQSEGFYVNGKSKLLTFMKSDSRSLSWRERLIQSFGKDPLICPNCKEKMLLWRIWHPDYGDIFDLSGDDPFLESESKQECKNRNSSGRQIKGIPQLLPF